MPTYRVRVEGRGIDFPIEGARAIGFFTTRQVRAATASEAELLVNRSIAAEWSSGVYAAANCGAAPVISAVEAWKVTWLQSLTRGPQRGYTFYASE